MIKSILAATLVTILTTSANAADFLCTRIEKFDGLESPIQIDLKNLSPTSLSFNVADEIDTYIRLTGRNEALSPFAFYGFTRGASYGIVHIPIEMLDPQSRATSYTVTQTFTLLRKDNDTLTATVAATCVRVNDRSDDK